MLQSLWLLFRSFLYLQKPSIDCKICSFHSIAIAEMEGDPASYTVDDALVSMGFGKYQFLVLAYSGLGWVSEAMEIMLLSFVGPSVQSEWNLSAQQESLITSFVFVGMLFGAYCWGIVSDSYGRRMGFLFTSLVTSFAGLLSAFSPNYICLIISRFTVGVGVGGAPVLASWFLEFIPAPKRGIWMMVFSSFWTFGTILEASLAWAIMPTLGWRWLLALSSIPSFLLLLFYGVAPESPRYLCMKGRRGEASLILEKMAEMNCTTLPDGTLISDYKGKLDQDLNTSEETLLIRLDEPLTLDDTRSIMCGIGALCRLFSKKLIRTTLLLWIVFFGQAFSYYGVVLLTSELSRSCQSKDLHPTDSQDASVYRDVFITSFGELPGLVLSAGIVDKVGRKLSMSALLFISCLLLFPLVFHQTEVIRTSLLFGARALVSASFSILYIYAPEVYPTGLRTTGVGTASSFGRIGGIICPLVAVGMVQGCHLLEAIVFFELVFFLSAVAILFFPLETSGRELSDTLCS